MEQGAVLYVCEGGERIGSISGLWRFVRGALPVEETGFCGQQVVRVSVPLLENPAKRGWFFRLARQYYRKLLQARLWDILLSCQNETPNPAFCSPGIYHSFSDDVSLGRELWLTMEFPPVLVAAALSRFLKKECIFRRNTRVFIVCNEEIPVRGLLLPYCDRLNNLQLLVKQPKAYEAFADEMLAEYGLAVGLTGRKEQGTQADILIDLARERTYCACEIKKGCLYFEGFKGQDTAKEFYGRRDILLRSTDWYWRRENKI